MPHKVNPIDFENSEGNLGLANALFEIYLLNYLFRDYKEILQIATVLRNVGVPICITSYCNKSLSKGIKKLDCIIQLKSKMI